MNRQGSAFSVAQKDESLRESTTLSDACELQLVGIIKRFVECISRLVSSGDKISRPLHFPSGRVGEFYHSFQHRARDGVHMERKAGGITQRRKMNKIPTLREDRPYGKIK